MTNPWTEYRGNGIGPNGTPVETRGERGRYLADPELVIAVNTAIAVGQPLLLTGEPGTGKTMLAWSVAAELGLGKVLEFHTASDSKAKDTLYSVDNLRRFYDAQTQDPRTKDLANYVEWRPLGEAIRSPERRLVLIDEIDKAPRDFPNDLLDVIDQLEFQVPELGKAYRNEGPQQPIVIITSNSERQLPPPFLRRCVFHYIEFPRSQALKRILEERLGTELPARLVDAAIARFQELRAFGDGLEKKPSTSELVAWLKVLQLAGIDADDLEKRKLSDLPSRGALIKTDADDRMIRGQAR